MSNRRKIKTTSVPSMTPAKMLKTLITAFENKLQLLLVGAPGVGKTELVLEAARRLGYNVIIMHPVVCDPTDFKGLPCLVDGKAVFLPFKELQDMIDAKTPTIVFLDDLGQASAAVQSAVMQLILGGKLNGISLSEHVIFVGATNRREDMGNVQGILEPVKSRWHSIVGLEVDVETWLQWAEDNGINKYVRAFIARRPLLLHDFKPSQDMVNTPSPRTVVNGSKVIDAKFDPTVLRTLLAGSVGQGWADEYLAFMDMVDRMIDPNMVIQAPKDVDVPTDHDVLYVLCQALSERATDLNFNNIMDFCNRIEEREFQKLLVSVATKRDKSLKNTTGYITWAAANPELHN
jgi:DNA polymerase III delta prime subunit